MNPITTTALGRSDILDMMGSLKLFSMRSAFDEAISTAVKRHYEPLHHVSMIVARLPLAKDIADFGSPINESLVHDLNASHFLAEQRNCVLVGGTGTGKTHLAIAITRGCIRAGKRGRFVNTLDLLFKHGDGLARSRS